MSKVYKVVWVRNCEFVSCTRGCLDDRFRVKYTINKLSLPSPLLPGSKLFAFSDIAGAREMLDYYNWRSTHKILECEAIGITSIGGKPELSCGYAKEYWKAKRHHKKIPNHVRIHYHKNHKSAIFCEMLMPRKVVQ